MCGIAGEIALRAGEALDGEPLIPMIQVLAHRGPDQWGYYADRGRRVVLLHTRLSIVDPETGRQPLCNEDGSVWVSCNGEIYGFKDLTRQLAELGHRFRSRSDTETIVHLYEEHGEPFVERLRGEFAFALFDAASGTALLVRDRFGIKPLYYAQLGERIVFASEIKALLRHPKFLVTLDRRSTYRFLNGALLPGETIFSGVQQVEPGCYLRIKNGTVRQLRYWELPLPEGRSADRSEVDRVEEFHSRFREAVRLRLHGDTEVGSYLSGGVDSALVTSTMAELCDRPVKAYSIGFEDDLYDETAAASAVARACGLDHRIIQIRSGYLADHFVRSLWHSEIPVINTHGTAKFLLSRLAGQEVKVVLTGEGADEILAGYAYFRHALLLEASQRTPRDRAVRRRLRRFLLENGPQHGVLNIRALPDYNSVVDRFGAYPYGVLRAKLLRRKLAPLLARSFRREMADLDPLEELAERMDAARMAGMDSLTASQYLAIKTDLVNYNLNYLGDRQEMAHSVEGRLPYLDHELVQFVWQLPIACKLDGEINKVVLRSALRKKLSACAQMPKKVFLAPSLSTLGLTDGNCHLLAYLSSEITKEVSLFDPLALGFLRKLLRILPAGSRQHARLEGALIAALSIHVLYDLFCKNSALSGDQLPAHRLDYSPRVGTVARPEVLISKRAGL